MSEPDWAQFRIDPVFDNPGTKQSKLEGFMHAFIEWRESIPRLNESVPTQNQGAGSPNRKARKIRKKRAQ